MGKMQRNKGATFERLVANKIKALRPDLMPKRGIGQARSSSEVPDVDIKGLWVECKHHVKVDVEAAMRQAKEAATSHGAGRVPVVIYRNNRGPIRVRFYAAVSNLLGAEWYLATMDADVALDDFLELIPQLEVKE